MSKSIKISPKHGLNPSIPVCFWCGQPKNEILLFGKMDKKDSEAPMHICMDYEPCEACSELFKKGIHVIGVTQNIPKEGSIIPIHAHGEQLFYPTGAYFVGTEDFIRRIVPAESVDAILKHKKLLMDDSIVRHYIAQNDALQKESE